MSEAEGEDALYRAAAALPAGPERSRFVDQSCAGDAELHRRLDARLAGRNPTLEPPSPALAAAQFTPDAPADEQAIGERIGRYKILEKIGEGGCGVVYVAEQSSPMRRRVALKVIKLGMDTKAVVARFGAERQALAMMDHPNIAKILDAGATDQGRPYFVMELVRGIKITDYCDQNRLPIPLRLDLFIQVCQAIQHAHQKGIIHRDIKPSNILITLHDGTAVPKVIDFGIAKATEGRLSDLTVYTQLQQFIGTPAYMSPEQAEMSGLDVDTRSDIYSLGVVLYELLTGRTPFEAGELTAQAIDTVRRTIREKEPARPSTKLSSLKADDLTATAKQRGAEPPRLISLVRGDLDWIAVKCLEKDRTHRYETAAALAADVNHYLNDEPIAARPPSRVYRLEKLVRRNKPAFAAGLAVVLALLLGMVISVWQAVRATRAESAAKQAESLALQTRGDAERLSNFMFDDFYDALWPTGRFDTLARMERQALAYYDGLPPSMRTRETARNRAGALARLALITALQGDAKTAMPMAQEAAATLDQMRQQGDQSEGTIYALALALDAEAASYSWLDDREATVGPSAREAQMLRPLALSVNGSRRVKLEYTTLVADYLCFTQPPEEGIATCEEALGVLAGLGALDFSDLSAASQWANIADSEARLALVAGRVEDAERLEREGESLAQGVVARRPTDMQANIALAWAPEGLACAEAKLFHDDAALELAVKSRQAAKDYQRFNPSDSWGWMTLIGADACISTLQFRKGEVREALRTARAAMQNERDLGNVPENVRFLLGLGLDIARWEAQCGNRDAAEQAIEDAKRFYEAVLTHTGTTAMNRVWMESTEDAQRQIMLAFGQDATVYALSTDALPKLEKASAGVTDPEMQATYVTLRRRSLNEAARAALNMGRYADAEKTAQDLLALTIEPGPISEDYFLDQPDDPAWGTVLLAQAQVGQGRAHEALHTIQPALAYYQGLLPQAATDVFFCQHYARALYVEALAQGADRATAASARASIDQALALLQALPDEAQQLQESKQLLSWLSAAREK